MFRWLKNKIIGTDPNPQPSILDVLDSRGTVPLDEDECGWGGRATSACDNPGACGCRAGAVPQHVADAMAAERWAARVREAAKRGALS